MSRSDALAAYEKLPLPDTTEEHWRFTDLRGFDPDAFRAPRRRRSRRCSTSTSPATRPSPPTGSTSSRRPRAIVFAPLPEDNERLYSLVGWDEKFAAHNAALWQARAPRRRPEGRRAREAALRPHLRDRPDLLAARRRRGGGRPRVADRGVRVARRPTPRPTRTPSPSSSSSRRRSSSTSPSRTSRARRGTSRTTTRASSATPSSTGSPAASARRRARRGSRTTSTAAARPRA